MRRLTVVISLVAIVAISPRQAAAQARPQTREGLFLGLGLGWGALSCSECGGDRESGLSGYVKLGGTVSDRWLLGFEGNAWAKDQNGVRVSQVNASAVSYVYPHATGGFFIKGGFGISTLRLDVSEGGSASDTGLGMIVGLGYDARVGSGFSLTPYANFVHGSFDGGSTTLIQAGLGLTWH